MPGEFLPFVGPSIPMKHLALLLALLAALPMLLGGRRRHYGPAEPLDSPDRFPESKQIFQQNGGVGDIPVRGFYDPVQYPAAVIEARWADGPWAVVDPAPQAGVFEGVLADQPVGWGELDVRIAGGPTLYEIPEVGVGEVLAIAGQSNAVMVTESLRTSMQLSSTLPLEQPGPDLFKWTADPLHLDTDAWGSVWPLLADALTEQTGLPVMFVATAQGGAGLVDPPQWAVGEFYWNRMLQNVSVATAGRMCIRALLWFQGETDAISEVSYDDYKSALGGFAQALQSEVSCPVPLVAGVIGPNMNATEAAVETIRQAQRDAALEDPDVLPGPETWDLPTRDGVHFGDAAVPQLLERWCLALEAVAPLSCPPQ